MPQPANLLKFHQLLRLYTTRETAVNYVVIRRDDTAMRRLHVPNPLLLRTRYRGLLGSFHLLPFTFLNLHLYSAYHDPPNDTREPNRHVSIITHHRFHA